jgi:hypothetical protein
MELGWNVNGICEYVEIDGVVFVKGYDGKFRRNVERRELVDGKLIVQQRCVVSGDGVWQYLYVNGSGFRYYVRGLTDAERRFCVWRIFDELDVSSRLIGM